MDKSAQKKSDPSEINSINNMDDKLKAYLETEDDLEADETLAKLLEPDWSSNEVINLFYEEREKIINRDAECQNLLNEVNSVLEKMLSLQNLYKSISPQTSQLNKDCDVVIQEKIHLKQLYDRIKFRLMQEDGSKDNCSIQ